MCWIPGPTFLWGPPESHPDCFMPPVSTNAAQVCLKSTPLRERIPAIVAGNPPADRERPPSVDSVTKVANARHHHRQVRCVGSLYHRRVLLAPARLHNRSNPCRGR